MTDWQMSYSAARFFNNNNGTFFQCLVETKGRLETLDNMRRSRVVKSKQDDAHNAPARERRFLHAISKKAVTCCASSSAVDDADAVARHSPANKPMVVRFTPTTTIVACAPLAAF